MRKNEIVDAEKDEDGQRADLESALNKIYQEVTAKVDGNGTDLTPTKPYIMTTMVPPEKEALSKKLVFINDVFALMW